MWREFEENPYRNFSLRSRSHTCPSARVLGHHSQTLCITSNCNTVSKIWWNSNCLDQQIYIFGTRAAVQNGDEGGNGGGYLFIYLLRKTKGAWSSVSNDASDWIIRQFVSTTTCTYNNSIGIYKMLLISTPMGYHQAWIVRNWN